MNDCPFKNVHKIFDHELYIIDYEGLKAVGCKCGAEGPLMGTEATAKDAWNTRHEPKHETVEQLKNKLEIAITLLKDGISMVEGFEYFIDIDSKEYSFANNATDFIENKLVADHHGKPEDV